MNDTKLLIFDLDGVLCDCRDLHYESLNRALELVHPNFIIDRQEHLSRYDGLSTNKKLDMLISETGFPPSYRQKVWDDKQRFTWELIGEMQPDIPMKLTLRKLKEDGYTIAVASNSVRHTVKLMLVKRGLMEYIDFFYANDDVKHPKPATEMYLKCMIKAGVSPKETLILEDSQHGRRGALATGAHLLGVKNTSDVTYNNIKSMISHIQTHYEVGKEKWSDRNLSVVVPMSGMGSRFQAAGYTFPKPLIEVRNGDPMIKVVIDNLGIKDAHFIYIVQKEHYDKYNLKTLLNLITPNCSIIQTDGVTEGAACSVLLAKELINNDNPLVIANSDQYIPGFDSFDFMYSSVGDDIDGNIVTFEASHPKWSFVELDYNGYVTRLAEKDPISTHATAGIYYFRSGADFVKYTEQMIDRDIRTRGEFYLAPVYNQFVEDGKRIKTYQIQSMLGLGTPEDLQHFLTVNPI